jgi:hypothetical protein
MTTLGIELPITATRMSANTNPGKARMTSVRRMITSSNQLPQYPAITPISEPITIEAMAMTTPMDRSSLAACTARAKTSLPNLSVPKRLSPEGGWRAFEGSVVSGSPTNRGPRTATST